MVRLALSLLVAMVATAAQADFSVNQQVSYSGDSKANAEFRWAIGDRTFRLDVLRGGDMTSFVFNGQVFFACARLDKARVEAVRKLKVRDPAFLSRLERGVCQDLSIDFVMRFFLSPYDAIGSVEQSAGFSTSLAVEDAAVELTGAVSVADNVKCVGFTRRYTLADKKRLGNQDFDEATCNAPTIKWRQSLGRQLSMTLIRQPSGKNNYQALNAELKKMPGFPLTSTAKITGKDGTGKALARSYKVQTTRIVEAALKPADFGFPSGFEVLDSDVVEAVAKSSPDHGTSDNSQIIDTVKLMILGILITKQ